MIKRLLFAAIFLAGYAAAQTSNSVVVAFASAPSGNCSFLMFGLDLSIGELYTCPAGSWVKVGGGSVSGTAIPAGTLTLLTSGSCSAGWTEASDLDGVTVIGTIAAHADVGATGGSNSVTPAGTVSQPTLSMNSFTPAGSNSAPAFTGTAGQSTSSDSAGTPAGTVAAPTFTGSSGTVPAETISYPVNVPTFAGSAGTVPAQTFSGSSANPSAVSAGTPAGTNTGGAFTQGALSWPVEVPTNASGAFTQGAISWPAGVPTLSGSTASESAHSHELPWQIPSTTTIRQIAVATFGTGTSRAATAVSAAGTANTTSAAVALSGPGSAHSHTVGTLAAAWPAGVPTIAAGVFTQPTVSWPAGVPTIAAGVFTQPTFGGSALATHFHAVTATGTNSTSSFTPAGTVAWPANPPTNSTVSFTPAGTNSAPAFSGSALAGHSHTLTPAGSVAAPVFSGTPATPTGSVSQPTFTGASADNRSAFVKVIFCRKN